MYFLQVIIKEIHVHGKLLCTERTLGVVSFQSYLETIAEAVEIYLNLYSFRYIINFLLDSSVGLFILYIGIRLCQYLSRAKHWDSFNFGEYGEWVILI